ncbi:SusE domain-containing protein [Segatella copri]|uniref:SusE domain-containing protein n=1 Tax=Segatella copri TaxID=165179 RepID=A0AAW5TYW3_9BACT|nr:SusE domain-containing protein [Segatella copri]MCW4077808.1 SusE domain-containing protein [Segatella copri]MCW4093797.1 SusE domain-containing protein [Segatella copri]MCW4108885.1 SusE domain-containing protein [Segatella copri]
MKNKYIIGALLIGIISLFASCSDDNDSNPTLIQPKEFTLNTPEYANATIDLERSTGLELTWSQPKYTADNAPINATYEVQVSPTNSFTVSTDEAAADESGEKVPDYAVLSNTTQKCNISASAEEMDKALVKILKWTEGNVPAEQEMYVRINAYILEGTNHLNPVASNSVKLKVKPYYIELKDAVPTMWYLVGNMFGAKWANDKNIGVDALPMFLKPNFSYDKKTGAGEIEYTNYFLTGDYNDKAECDGAGFKIMPSSFNWDYCMNADGATKGTIVNRNGGSDGGHIVAETAGYYTITLNTADNTAKMVKYEGNVTNYGTIQISGSFNDWADTPMLPYNTEGVENHAWYYVMDVPAGETAQFKFKIEGSWDTSWGYGAEDGAINMYGKCDAGGKNIGLAEGKYVISFNDITGSFSIVKL